MSNKDFKEGVVKSVGDVQNPSETKLTKLAEENGGFFTYEDRHGATTEGQIGENGFSKRDKLAEKRHIQDLFGKIEDAHKTNDKLEDAIEEAYEETIKEVAQKSEDTEKQEVEKALGVNDYTAEIFLSDEMTLVSQEYTPVDDTLPRTAVPRSDTVKIDEIADIAQADSSDATSGNPLPSVSHNFNPGVEYNIKVIGLETGVEDRVRLTGQRYNPEETQAELNARAIERYRERQSLRGTYNDADGYLGVADFADAKGTNIDVHANYDETSQDDVEMDKRKLSDLVDALEDKRVSRANMLIVLSLDAHRNLRESLSDLSRIIIGQSNEGEVDLSFNAFTFEGVTVSKSHSLNGQNEAYALDVSQHFYGVLRDVTVKALPPNQLDDRMVTYAEMTLVSRARGRTVRMTNVGVTA